MRHFSAPLPLSPTMNTSRVATLLVVIPFALAAQQKTMKPEDTEYWSPVPKVITPGRTNADAPSDAIVLFDGRNLDAWVTARDKSPAKWTIANGVMTVDKKAGDIQTKRSFKNYQIHLEWRIPEHITGKDQERGNSGLYLASTPET